MGFNMSGVVLVTFVMSLAALLLMVVAGWAIMRLTKQLDVTRSRLAGIEREVNGLLRGAVGMGHRIVALEKRLNSTASNQDTDASTADGFAYTQAMQMFEQGADVETVASSCGFSSSEAQLMALVQKQLKSKPSRNRDPA